MARDRLTPVGVVVAAQGVRGHIRVKTFTETPATLDAYGPLTDAEGAARYGVRVVEARETVAIVRVEGVTDRTAAEKLKGRMLYLRRDALPEPEAGEYLHADLIGLPVETAAEGRIDQVAALEDYGAGDLDAGRIRIDPPPGLWPRSSGRDRAGPAEAEAEER